VNILDVIKDTDFFLKAIDYCEKMRKEEVSISIWLNSWKGLKKAFLKTKFRWQNWANLRFYKIYRMPNI